jgi:hypothetical protein
VRPARFTKLLMFLGKATEAGACGDASEVIYRF